MKFKLPIIPTIIAGVLLVFVGLVISGNVWWFSEDRPLMMIPDMDDHFKVKPQTGSTFFADGKSNREPVENTMPREGNYYKFAMADADQAIEFYKAGNPLLKSEFVLARGENRFNTFCSPCHNYNAKGDGLVQQRGFGAKETMDLTRDVAKAYPDGKFFHIISAGQNIMPAYADRISETDRWAIVHYIREMQGNPAPVSAPSADTSAAANNQKNTNRNVSQLTKGN